MFALFKIFPYIIPFLKDMILGKKTWGEAFRDNKKKTFFAILVIISFGLNFILVPKLTGLATRYIALNREFMEYKTSHPDRVASTQKHPTDPNGKEVTAQVPEKEQVVKAQPTHDNKHRASTDDIRAEFARMREREAAEH